MAGARLPLGFIGLGLVALLAAAIWVALEPALIGLPHASARVVALTHVWLPGFLLSVCMGAVYQLMPVVLGAELRLPVRLAWAHLALHAAGVPLLAAGFATGRFGLVAVAGSAVAAGILVLVTATWRTFRASPRRDAIAWSFPLATTWLATTVLFGVVLALNRRSSFLPLAVADLLRAHAHLGLAGFFVTLLQGATFQLVPMFTLADLHGGRLVTVGLVLAQVGLVGLVPGLACARPVVATLAACVLAAGIACSGAALVATLRSRRRRTLEPGLQAFAGGAALLGAATVAGLVLALRPAPAEPSTVAAYGTIVIAGALTFMVLGMLCKIVPFLVWMRAYGPRAGRQPVPLATALGWKQLEFAWLGLHALAVTLLLAGLLGHSTEAVVDGTRVLLAGIVVFIANIVRIVVHLIRPEIPAPPAPRGAALAS